MLDVRRMRVLREVVMRGSFSAAAQSLHLTQPAVSRHVRKLEQEADAQLLVRTSRGLRPTDAGRVVLEHAERILGQLAAAERGLEAVAGLETGRLRVGSFPHGGAALVVDALAGLHRRHPRLRLSFRDASSGEGLRLVRAGELDVAVAFQDSREPLPEDDGLARIRLLEDPMYVALARTHPLAARRSIRIVDLADEGWTHGTQSRVSGLILRVCREAGFEPRIVAETDHAAISQGLVAAGLAVTLVPGLAVSRVGRRIAVRPIAGPPLVRLVYAATLDADPRPRAIEACLEALGAAAVRYSAPPAAAGAATASP